MQLPPRTRAEIHTSFIHRPPSNPLLTRWPVAKSKKRQAASAGATQAAVQRVDIIELEATGRDVPPTRFLLYVPGRAQDNDHRDPGRCAQADRWRPHAPACASEQTRYNVLPLALYTLCAGVLMESVVVLQRHFYGHGSNTAQFAALASASAADFRYPHRTY